MKYQINGIDGVFEAGKLALAVLQDYCSKNECTFNELKEIFPDEVQGDKDYIKQKIVFYKLVVQISGEIL